MVTGEEGGNVHAAFMVALTSDGNVHTVSFAESCVFHAEGMNEPLELSQKRAMARVLNEAMNTLEPVRQARAKLDRAEAERRE